MPTKTEKVSGIAKFRQHQQLRKARTNLRARAVILVVGKRGDVVECTMRGRGGRSAVMVEGRQVCASRNSLSACQANGGADVREVHATSRGEGLVAGIKS